MAIINARPATDMLIHLDHKIFQLFDEGVKKWILNLLLINWN